MQFQRSLSLPEFLARYGTQAQCEAVLEQACCRIVFAVRAVAARPTACCTAASASGFSAMPVGI
jgi:hypothetical protein